MAISVRRPRNDVRALLVKHPLSEPPHAKKSLHEWARRCSLPQALADPQGLGSHGGAQHFFACRFVSHNVRTYLNLTTTRAAENVVRESVPLWDACGSRTAQSANPWVLTKSSQ